jgi:hypothetical protein
MDIHPNNTMKSRNATLFEDIFSFNEAQEKYSLNKMIKARSKMVKSSIKGLKKKK